MGIFDRFKKAEKPPNEEKPNEAEAVESEAEAVEAVESEANWFGRLKKGLSQSTSKITSSISYSISGGKIDPETLENIEEALILADVGVIAAQKLVGKIKAKSFPKDATPDDVKEAIIQEIAALLKTVARPIAINPQNKPHTIIMVGVNGSGKTTTAGKLAEQWRGQGKSVILAAADTFRAAATEQLEIWGQRTKTKVITGKMGADAAAVAFQAQQEAAADGADILIIDTAGRLQAKAELMEELAKIRRVINKQNPDAPHDAIIVLDGTVGQNAISQVAAFNETVKLSGMIVTKLDGSARGGIVIALAEKFALPIYAVGVGESKDDLQDFEAEEFARALLGDIGGGDENEKA